MNPLYGRFGVPLDIDTHQGLERLVSDQAVETRHLDFKRQINDVDELAEDLVAIVNSGGGVLIVGVGTDRQDRAASLHEHSLKVLEQQAGQAVRDGIDEPLRVDIIPVSTVLDPSRGYLIVAVPPSDRTPHVSSRRGRVLHRVGTHNRAMTRREIGAAFAMGGDMFALEFGLLRDQGGAAIRCELLSCVAGQRGEIKVTNTGGLPALDIFLESSVSGLRWADEEPSGQDIDVWRDAVPDPSYLPIRRLPPASDVVLAFERDWNIPAQDVLRVTWSTADGQTHVSEQSWTWVAR